MPYVQMQQNYPNPFNPNTNINFYIPVDDNISLSIYNVRGQKIKILYLGFIESGSHTLSWDGRDDFSRYVSSGIYFYKLTTSHGNLIKRMILIK